MKKLCRNSEIVMFNVRFNIAKRNEEEKGLPQPIAVQKYWILKDGRDMHKNT